MQYIKNVAVKLGKTAKRVQQKAQRIALAVVIMETLMVTGYALAEQQGYFDIFRQSPTIEIAQAHSIAPKQPQIDTVERLAEYVWMKESSKGRNNYSKCEAQGKINGIGYGIDGSGKYICFESHEQEMQVLRGWIIAKIAQGYTELELLCIYNINRRQSDCHYVQAL